MTVGLESILQIGGVAAGNPWGRHCPGGGLRLLVMEKNKLKGVVIEKGLTL